jgi:hypothetical protein
MTENQGTKYARDYVKERAKSSPVIGALLSVLLPLLIDFIKDLLSKNDVTPKETA